MIGASIGAAAIGGVELTIITLSEPDIVLYGVLGFQSSYRTRFISTLLDFTIVSNDDNIVQMFVNMGPDGLAVNLLNCQVAVSIYAPGTSSDPVITKTGEQITRAQGFFQFTLQRSDVSDLAPGHYQCIAVVNLADGSRHTITCGDIDMTTGLMALVHRPT